MKKAFGVPYGLVVGRRPDDAGQFCSEDTPLTRRLPRPPGQRGYRPGGPRGGWSPDGTRLAVAGIGVWVYNARTLSEFALLRGYGDPALSSVSFSPDGQTLASSSYDGTVRLWEVETQNNTPLVR